MLIRFNVCNSLFQHLLLKSFLNHRILFTNWLISILDPDNLQKTLKFFWNIEHFF
jgi:hypothetical protein